MNMQAKTFKRPTVQQWALGSLLALATFSVVVSLNAWAGQVSEPRPPMVGAMHHGSMMPMTGKGLERMLSHLDATAAQKEQIKKISDAAAPDLQKLRDEGQALHEQGAKLWAEPQLDAAAAEQLRQKMTAHHEQMSKRMMQVLLDVGQVLTPEQRAKMAKHMHSRRHGHRGDHGERATPRDN
jgi:protein CpxP